jgi:hypothetical protein
MEASGNGIDDTSADQASRLTRVERSEEDGEVLDADVENVQRVANRRLHDPVDRR